MAERHGQGVGRIGGLRRFRHGEERAHHQLHLPLIGVAAARNRSLPFTQRRAVHPLPAFVAVIQRQSKANSAVGATPFPSYLNAKDSKNKAATELQTLPKIAGGACRFRASLTGLKTGHYQEAGRGGVRLSVAAREIRLHKGKVS